MLVQGDIVKFEGKTFTVMKVFSRDYLKQMTSPEHYKDPDYGLLVKDSVDYLWRALVYGSSIDLKFIGTKYCPPAEPTPEQRAQFKERMEKLKQRKKEENEQVKNQQESKSRFVLKDEYGLPAKKRSAKKQKGSFNRKARNN